MNVEVRHDIAEQQIVDMTRLEHAFNGPADVLNVRPVIGKFVRCKIREGRDMAQPKPTATWPISYGVPFEQSLADAAAMEGPVSWRSAQNQHPSPRLRDSQSWGQVRSM